MAALLAAGLALLTIAVYAQVASHAFVDLDDGGYVVNNPHVNTGLSWTNLQWALTSGYAANWHPLTWMSHQLDVSLFGVASGPHHIVNVAWHVAGTLVLFGLLRAMTGAMWRSAAVAALFAVHPVHVESVAWLAERKDVLSAFFWFATTWAYVAWVRRPGSWRYAAIVCLFALGLMSKPMVVTLPFTLLLLDVWPLQRNGIPIASRIVEKLPLFAMAAGSSIVTAIVQQQGGAVGALTVISLTSRLANVVVSYARYLKMLVWPVDLAVLYPYVFNLPVAIVLFSGVVLGAISVGAWLVRKSNPAAIVGWLWFLGTLVPVIGFVQFGMHALADRYTYIPYVGLFLAIVWGVRDAATRLGIPQTALRAVALVTIVALAVAARAQVATWASTETMWKRAVAVTVNNPRAHNSLGAVYGNAGRTAEATAEFQEALRLNPDLTDAKDILPNLGRSLIAQGKTAEAIPFLERARQLNPERADVCHQLGVAYLAVDKRAEALASFREAVRLNPRFDEAFFAMGLVLAAEGRIEEARRALTEVLRINPARKDAQDALARLRF